MEKKHNLVYKTTNMINGKIYIGVHCTNNLDDGYIGCGIYNQIDAQLDIALHRAIRKHGYNNFKREILYDVESEELAYFIEELIVDKEFINRGNTYNCKTGGKAGGLHSEYTKNKMSIQRKGKHRKPLSEEHKKKISITRTGIQFTDEHKKKISENHAKCRRVICIDTKHVYRSIAEAAKATGTSKYGIQSCANLIIKTTKNRDGIKQQWSYI